ncbi:hypothetical protein CLV58_103218 [Spirosoma oryzae]|uniref:Uncharacterized protein n=1 Tax=Spirosoma oryzae TaxID=1469603 RepID=A0A2T0TF10_9BACT|nr:hypothetical protein CLV58_103218 [Spirosoma oryzae]
MGLNPSKAKLGSQVCTNLEKLTTVVLEETKGL